MSRVNYIYVDFENVHDADYEKIVGQPVLLRLIFGEKQKNVPLKLAKLAHKHPDQVRLVETRLNGKNALDFVLAYEIGAESVKDPAGYFHIISRDKGFDALVHHLKDNNIHAARHDSIGEIPLLMNKDERFKLLAAHYQTKTTGLPKKRKTLESHIQSWHVNTLSAEELETAINKLMADKIIAISDKGAVSYLH